MSTQATPPAPNPVEEEYPELFHYTSAAGLTGILCTQSLWASHASFQNDPEEITLFFDRRLATIIEEELTAIAPTRDQTLIRAEATQFKESIKRAAGAVMWWASPLMP